MRRSKIALAALAGLVATAANGNAAAVPNGGAEIQPISDAALKQVLAANWLDYLKGKGGGFKEIYWKGQAFKQAQLKNPLRAPSGDVAAVFRSLNIS